MRLSEPMRAALAQHGRLIVPIGPWGQDGHTVSALGRGGLMKWGGDWLLPRRLFTPEAGSWPSA